MYNNSKMSHAMLITVVVFTVVIQCVNSYCMQQLYVTISECNAYVALTCGMFQYWLMCATGMVAVEHPQQTRHKYVGSVLF